jgi:hypothetical protein
VQPALSSGEALYISDGYSTTSGTVVWGTPYVSSFRVGSLSALSADMGSITAGTITVNSTGFIRGGQTAYNTGTGFWLGYNGAAYKFSIGDGTNGLTWNGSALSVTGAITATSGSFTGTLKAGTIVYTGSGTAPVSGAGAIFNTGGTFSIGDTSNNITYNGTAITLNGNFVKNTNISVTDLSTINANMGAITAGSLSIGSGSTIFKVDTSGNIWSGNALYASAPFKVSNTGALVATGATISGAITATSGSFTGDLTSGTAALSGTYPSNTMTGAGFKTVAATGAFVLGNAATNFAFDGTNNIVVNGSIVKAGNINVTDLSTIKNDMGTIVAGSLTLNSAGFVRGGQTAYNTGVGFWLGNSGGTYKFSIGDPTGQSLTWSGSVLNLSGDVVTSGKIIGSGATTAGTTGVSCAVAGLGSTTNVGVFGESATGHAVRGVSYGTTSAGVHGLSSGVGVYGESSGSGSTKYGVHAVATQTSSVALRAQQTGTSGKAIYATTTIAGAAEVIRAEGSNNAHTALVATIPTGGAGFAADLTGGVRLNTGSPLTTGGSAGTTGKILTSNGSSSSPSWELIVNGGSGTADGSGSFTRSVNFSNSNYGLSGTSTSGVIVVITAVSSTSFTLQAQDRATGAPVPSAGIRWTAIGN